MKKLKTLLMALMLAFGLAAFTGCQDDAGDDMEDAVEEMGDNIGDAAEEAGDNVEDALD